MGDMNEKQLTEWEKLAAMPGRAVEKAEAFALCVAALREEQERAEDVQRNVTWALEVLTVDKWDERSVAARAATYLRRASAGRVGAEPGEEAV